MLKEGNIAPDFSLKDSEGKVHKLSDYKGKKVVLYFYPKDFTPGCTKEACDFRNNFSKINKKAVVIGISADSEASHKRFQEKYKLPFIVLSDPEKKVIKSYDVLKKKSFFGNIFLGIARSTFIIDEEGKIIKMFPKVKVSGHVKEVVESL